MDLNEAKAACEEYHRLGRGTIATGDALEWAITEIERRDAIPHGSRRAEVEAELKQMDEDHSARFFTNEYSKVAIALADEVDELRGKLDDVRMNIGCARGQRTTQYCAEAAARDEIITKMLVAIKPTDEDDRLREFSNAACDRYGTKQGIYRRALEITGRKE